MAWHDDWDRGGDYFDDEGPDNDKPYEILWGEGSELDQHAQDLFVKAYFDSDESVRASAYLDLVDYMWEEYHIDFDDTFDWTDFREWYDSAH